MLVAESIRTSRQKLAVIAAAVVLALAAVALLLVVRHGQQAAGLARDVSKLDGLPARPEDIEAHGSQAQTVLAPDNARLKNAAVPLPEGPIDRASPFVFAGSDSDRAKALQCLSTAVLYEAGDDTVGEAAVAQVVLNRVRHAAFPATVCGVVYQGARRSTGCQFTFTCDGSLRRTMPDSAWRRARSVADAALSGVVDYSVGLATHYHTDWVYPYWSPELRKLAQVGTHLFFGWPGSWGGPGAFGRRYKGNEEIAVALAVMPDMPGSEQMGRLPSQPGILGLPQAPARLPAEMGSVPLYGNKVRLVRADGRAFGLLAPSGAPASKLVSAALALCAKPGACQVNAWANEDDIPGEYPISDGAKGTMVFEFVRDGSSGKSALRFDCERFPNKDPKVCLQRSSGL